jgi:HEPN domain-containing protein
MGPNEKLYKKSYAPELMRIAQNDFLSGKSLAEVAEVRRETVLFHLEQAVEKALKATLCHLEKPLPFTHDIYAILQKFAPDDLPPGGYSLHDLTPFATIRRYEEGKYLIEQSDIDSAIALADSVLNWAQKKIQK